MPSCNEKCGALSLTLDGLLLYPKALYFVLFAAMACANPFMGVIYAEKGLSGNEIGVLTALPSFINFVASPAWTALADKTQKHVHIMVSTITVSTLMLLIIMLVNTFTILVPLVIIYSTFVAPIIPLIDSSVLELLGDAKNIYGRQRLWGAVSWGLAAVAVGALSDLMKSSRTFFICYAIGMCVLIALVLRLHHYAPVKTAAEVTDKPVPFISALRQLLFTWPMAFFLFSAFMMGAGTMVIFNFLFVFLRKQLHASHKLMGLSLMFTVIVELPFFFFAKHLLVLMGVRWMILSSHVAFCLRVTLYTILTSAWQVLPVELLHGITFAAMWAAGVDYASSMAPAGLEATAQGVFNGVYGGLGAGVGSVIGGVITERLGWNALWYLWAIAVAVSAGVFAISQWVVIDRCLKIQIHRKQAPSYSQVGSREQMKELSNDVHTNGEANSTDQPATNSTQQEQEGDETRVNLVGENSEYAEPV